MVSHATEAGARSSAPFSSLPRLLLLLLWLLLLRLCLLLLLLLLLTHR